jgi:2-oxoglutarate dehydrogenase E2 component (dihydrolipoamide succinyltransferase)
MPVEVRVPATGESVAEATVGAWLKQEGERVEAGEALVELETDKVNLEVAAEQSGVLERIERRQGETVSPGDLLAILATEVEAAADPRAQAGAAAPASSAPPADQAERPVERPHASPLARRIAQEHGLDLAQVAGSGTAGRVTREDVERYLESDDGADARSQPSATPTGEPAPPGGGLGGSSPAAREPGQAAAEPSAEAAPTLSSPASQVEAAPPTEPAARPPAERRPAASEPPGAAPARPAPPAQPAREERRRLSRRRLTIAQRLLEAQRTAVMLTTFNEADLSAVQALRARRRAAFRERHGVDLGLMSFFTRAVVAALKAFPAVNAEIQGEEAVYKHYYDIGIAVGAEEGLVVPVLRDADRLSFADLERQIGELAARARENRLTLDDLRGGTFTITNGGVFGSLLSTPLLSPPQVGILGMHRIEPRPVVRDGEVVIRPMMYLALTYDHRLIDGREAVQFLVRVRELIEDPERLLLEG